MRFPDSNPVPEIEFENRTSLRRSGGPAGAQTRPATGAITPETFRLWMKCQIKKPWTLFPAHLQTQGARRVGVVRVTGSPSRPAKLTLLAQKPSRKITHCTRNRSAAPQVFFYVSVSSVAGRRHPKDDWHCECRRGRNGPKGRSARRELEITAEITEAR